MGSIREYFAAIGRTITSLGDGFAVTFSYMFRKPNTIQYPDRSGQPVVKLLPERSRGLIEIDIDICTGCKACERACPINVIKIEVEKHEELGRMLTVAAVDWSKCMFCGLCVEPCPSGAIRHSHEFEGGMRHQRSLIMDFVDEPLPVAKIKKGEPVDLKPVGCIVRSRLPDFWSVPTEPKKKELPPVSEAFLKKKAAQEAEKAEKAAKEKAEKEKAKSDSGAADKDSASGDKSQNATNPEAEKPSKDEGGES